MDDLISRQAAIEAIKNCESGENFEYNEGLIAAMNAVVDTPSAQEWTPVSERMPEMTGIFLVTIKSVINEEMPYVEIADYAPNLYKIDPYNLRKLKGRAGFYQFDSEYGFVHRDDVIAWMPLPEPPKEEEARKKYNKQSWTVDGIMEWLHDCTQAESCDVCERNNCGKYNEVMGIIKRCLEEAL